MTIHPVVRGKSVFDPLDDDSVQIIHSHRRRFLTACDNTCSSVFERAIQLAVAANMKWRPL